MREICAHCSRPSPVSFTVPDVVWKAAVPSHLSGNCLCITCFAMFGDERLIAWDRKIECHPCSLRSYALYCDDNQLDIPKDDSENE